MRFFLDFIISPTSSTLRFWFLRWSLLIATFIKTATRNLINQKSAFFQIKNLRISVLNSCFSDIRFPSHSLFDWSISALFLYKPEFSRKRLSEKQKLGAEISFVHSVSFFQCFSSILCSLQELHDSANCNQHGRKNLNMHVAEAITKAKRNLMFFSKVFVWFDRFCPFTKWDCHYDLSNRCDSAPKKTHFYIFQA